ncbi:MAG: helix-turn-helix domain-containing protein [Planctomycetales bacterium]
MTYDVKQVAERYDVTQQTVLGWIHRGELKAFNVGVEPGKKKPRWRITESALAAFEALRTPTPPAPVVRRKRQPADVIDRY